MRSVVLGLGLALFLGVSSAQACDECGRDSGVGFRGRIGFGLLSRIGERMAERQGIRQGIREGTREIERDRILGSGRSRTRERDLEFDLRSRARRDTREFGGFSGRERDFNFDLNIRSRLGNRGDEVAIAEDEAIMEESRLRRLRDRRAASESNYEFRNLVERSERRSSRSEDLED